MPARENYRAFQRGYRVRRHWPNQSVYTYPSVPPRNSPEYFAFIAGCRQWDADNAAR